jgi:hypothetical protein
MRLHGQAASEETRTEADSSRTSGQMRMPRASSLLAPDIGNCPRPPPVEHRARGQDRIAHHRVLTEGRAR